MIDLIVHSASQLLTVAGQAPKSGASQGDLVILEDGAVAISGEEIVAVGPTQDIQEMAEPETRQIDAEGHVVLPGFVDAHTHAIFAGDRVEEFEMRLRGATYLDIMSRGGGIMSTVRATRAASLQRIAQESRARLDRMLTYGTTTAEVKSGYGLDVETEIRLLDAIGTLNALHLMDLIPTFMGAHAIPEEFRGAESAFVDLVVEKMLPEVVRVRRIREGLAEPAQGDKSYSKLRPPLFCDVFCDEGAFTLEQSERILTRARGLDFALKIHADEFAHLGGAALAARMCAVSADHLMRTPRRDMKKMAEANVIAVLLPATTFGLGKTDFANGREFVAENVAVALGSDLNPGTSWCESMQMVMAIATRFAGLEPAAALVAATLNAAYASGVGDRVGSIEPGKLADILVTEVSDHRQLTYRYGTNLIRHVIKRGRLFERRMGSAAALPSSARP